MTDFGQRRRQLLKTGQKDLFHIGDDGDLEMGLARSYTVLTTGQYAGSVDITVHSKVHSLSNNTVQDNSTGLMWARYVPDDDIGPDSNGKLLWIDAANSEDIFAFVAQANAKILGGYSDWRLPNPIELDSIIDFGKNSPSIDTTAFPSTPSGYHWSSGTRDALTTNAWRTSFASSIRGYTTKIDVNLHCRLVRGGV